MPYKGRGGDLVKHSTKEAQMNAISDLNLTPDNLITLYTSAYLNGKGLDRESRGPEMDVLINQISYFVTDWQIKRMDVTIRGDVVVAV